MKQLILLVIVFLIKGSILAQQGQTIRGHVTDKDSKTSLPGANVVLLNVEPLTGTVTDADGNFRLDHVTLGRQDLQVTYIGYKPAVFQGIIVNSVKEIVLEVNLRKTF